MGAMKEVFMERCQKWADDINGRYGLFASDAEVADVCNNDKWFMDELVDNSFTDTSPREAMAGEISRKRIGMEIPCYGDSSEYKVQYNHKMTEWLLEEGILTHGDVEE